MLQTDSESYDVDKNYNGLRNKLKRASLLRGTANNECLYAKAENAIYLLVDSVLTLKMDNDIKTKEIELLKNQLNADKNKT